MSIQPTQVHATLGRSMITDGHDMVCDLKKSKGCRIYDSRSQKYLLDCFSFFATAPIGFNHPRLITSAFIKQLGEVAVHKPSNSDIYTVEMAEFVDSFRQYAVPSHFKHLFFISGGALAIENGLKTAFDWKIRKNMARGTTEERGTQVIHFKEAFHGRTGYTLSMTNTFNLNKIKYFPKFTWPRILNPKITFPLNASNLADVQEREQQALTQIDQAIQKNPDDIAALIIEPIQGEGGDNHFRKEFFKELRRICDTHDIMFIVDEVQTGVGLTGKMWAYEHFDFKPDILAFGKKTQVCGIMVSNCVEENKENVFSVPSRLNSTWGGSLVDMVRCQKYLEIIHDEKLIHNAEQQGKRLLSGLIEIQERYPEIISNARGRGLMCAFDLPTPEQRDAFNKELYKNGLVVLTCGATAIRYRPALVISEKEIDESLTIINKTLQSFK
jgi:L-lysine 6-transaminase